MKRGTVILEPWSTKEKLCLASAVLRSGDQNWMSVSRVLRVFGEPDRPSEWYSQKQCALQYEALLNNVGTTKRKKRSEKGVETIDTPSESIVRKLLQERQEEVNRLIEEDRKAYLRLLKEIEDIESGKADDRLDEFELEIEEEKEKEATRGSILRQHEERSRLEGGRVTPYSEPQETKVATSPLLTSLLQSPSSYRGGSIQHLLNPPPPPPSYSTTSDSPTLSRLLESPAKQIEPTVLFSSPVKKEPIEEDSNPAMQPEPVSTVEISSTEVVEEVDSSSISLGEIKEEIPEEKEENNVEMEEPDMSGIHMQEVEVEMTTDGDKPSVEVARTENEEQDGQDGQDGEQEQSSLTNLQDSDTMEEQQSITELDSQTVNMIVAGGGVISVSHDTSGEHLEEVTSSDIQNKDDSEAAESLDGASDNGEIKETEAEVDNFIIGPETPKNNYVVQLLYSTPDNSMEEESKTPEVKGSPKTPGGAVLEVGGEMVSLGGAVVVEEEVDTTVHEVEVLVSDLDNTVSSSHRMEVTDVKESTISSTSSTPVLEECNAISTPVTSKYESEVEVKTEDDKHSKDSPSTSYQMTAKIIESKPASPCVEEEDAGKRPSKKRLISGSVCSDSKPSSPAPQLLEDSKDNRAWKKSIMLVYNRLATHKYASMFLKPITNEQAPAYDTVVHRPVDLFTIKKRIEVGDLRTTVEFQRDLLLMFQNAIMYNNSESLVYEMASIMQNECLQHIELMVEAMGEGVPWRKDPVNVDKLHTRARSEAPKRKRNSLEDAKSTFTPKRRRDNST
ncbi:bromodomain-containing protein 8-like [Macrosteles quadrilineatus]|uniref:bromodomain-containing protein 8-like n=1 Tax=Macrosteles quadrilineatus TaxID=74068 RepID=UPI0023E30F4A|nr:bromodomain-containing protein 8-like [Macrosteles quadrilineatus]